MVEFPANGLLFGRYGTIDAGGVSGAEIVGQGDRYLRPIAAAALFGIANSLTNRGFMIDFGDMSSSNGSDPWQPGGNHHAGHGHMGKRSGLDVDFRYVDADGLSFQSSNAFENERYDSGTNQIVYDTAKRFGFTKNFQGLSGNLDGPTKIPAHNDHGHLGLQFKDLNWKYVKSAPTNGLLFNFNY